MEALLVKTDKLSCIPINLISRIFAQLFKVRRHASDDDFDFALWRTNIIEYLKPYIMNSTFENDAQAQNKLVDMFLSYENIIQASIATISNSKIFNHFRYEYDDMVHYKIDSNPYLSDEEKRFARSILYLSTRKFKCRILTGILSIFDPTVELIWVNNDLYGYERFDDKDYTFSFGSLENLCVWMRYITPLFFKPNINHILVKEIVSYILSYSQLQSSVDNRNILSSYFINQLYAKLNITSSFLSSGCIGSSKKRKRENYTNTLCIKNLYKSISQS